MQSRPLRYVLVLIAVVAAAHLAWSALVVHMLREVSDHRVSNVRKLKDVDSDWEDFTSAFAVESAAAARRAGRPHVMFMGSSVTWGYPWHEPVIYSTLAARDLPDRKVTNLSVVGAGIRLLSRLADCAIDDTRRPAVLLLEVPLVNAVANARAPQGAARGCARPGPAALDYWGLVLSRPYGVGWAAQLWDEEAYAKPEEPLQIARLAPDYFADQQAFAALETAFAGELREFLTRMSTKGDKVYVYISPILTAAIEPAGGDRRSVERQIDLAQTVCREVGTVVCLDTREFSDRKELFYNLTHLNQRGHRALADWFVRHIAR